MATLSNPTYFYNQDKNTAFTGKTGYVGWGDDGKGGGNCTRIVRYTLKTDANESASKVTIQLFTENKLSWAWGCKNITADIDLGKLIIDNDIDFYGIISSGEFDHVAAGVAYVRSDKHPVRKGSVYETCGKYPGISRAYLQPYYDKSNADGTVNISDLRFHVELTLEYDLKPSSDYYIWIFPGRGWTSDDGYDTYYGVFKWDDEGSSGSFTRKVYVGGIPAEGDTKAGVVHIYTGSSFEPYQPYIFNGSTWEQYEACIYNGTTWDTCG